MSDIFIRPQSAMGILASGLKRRFPDFLSHRAKGGASSSTRDPGAAPRDADQAGSGKEAADSTPYGAGSVEPGTLLAASLLAASMPMSASGAAMMIMDRSNGWTPPASSLSLRDRTA